MGRLVRRLSFLTLLVLSLLATTYVEPDIVVDIDGRSYIVDEFVPTYYEFEYDNVGTTTINGLSNIYCNMKKEGYEIYKENITSTGIDVSFIKVDSPSYRFYYEKHTGGITIFCSEYESSVNGQAYISEDKE